MSALWMAVTIVQLQHSNTHAASIAHLSIAQPEWSSSAALLEGAAGEKHSWTQKEIFTHSSSPPSPRKLHGEGRRSLCPLWLVKGGVSDSRPGLEVTSGSY